MNIYKQFGYLSQGYKVPAPGKKSKTHGTLLLDGLPVVQNKPFFVLQMEKKKNYYHIHPKTRLKIVAMME